MHAIGRVVFVGLIALVLSGCEVIGGILLDGAAGEVVIRARSCGEYRILATDEQVVTPEIRERTRTIIEDRVDAYGVVGSVVRTEGPDRVLVELSGVTTGSDIQHLIEAPGVLEFVPVPSEYFGQVAQGLPLPEGMADVEALIDGSEIADAGVGRDEMFDEFIVDLELSETGARLFDGHAEAHLGEPVAIVLDDIVLSVPVIRATLFDGQAQISAGFTAEEANELVTVLRSGSLPLEIREVAIGTCS